MRNVWFVPTASALVAMLERTKFRDVQLISDQAHQPEEQRTTPWNPGPSYEDFLSQSDPSLTKEGHAAPRRSIVIARKPGPSEPRQKKR